MALELFAKLTKVDEEQRLVYGRAVDETPDRSGEVFDYATSKANFQKWSDETQAASSGQSLGNLRAMHGKVAAGKLTGIDFDDTAKAIDVVAKVVDDNEWKKVLEGVYTGFSIGGAYVKKWDDPKVKKADGGAMKRYTAAPSELSLVDRPCIPSAKFFDIRKADGATEQHEFKSVLAEADIEMAARTLAKASGFDPDSTDGVNQPLWKAYAAQAAEQWLDLPKVDEAPIEYQVEGSDAEVAKLATVMHDEKLAMADVLKAVDSELTLRALEATMRETQTTCAKLEAAGTLKKGMYLVGQLAQIVSQLENLRDNIVSEEAREGDAASVLPQKSLDLLGTATDLLQAMVIEESAEVLGDIDDDGNIGPSANPVLAMAHFGALRKVGKRNSASDADRIKKMHDLAVELGADCGTKEAAHTHDGLAKGASPGHEFHGNQYSDGAAEAAKLSEKAARASTKALADGSVRSHAAALRAHQAASAAHTALAHAAPASGEKALQARGVHYQAARAHDLASDPHIAAILDKNPAYRFERSDDAVTLAKADVEGIVEGMLNKIRADNAAVLTKLEASNSDLLAKVAKLEALPAAPRGVLRAISKGAELGEEGVTVQPVLSKGAVNEAASLIKMAHQSGGVSMGLRPDGSSIL